MSNIEVALPRTYLESAQDFPDKTLVSIDLFNNGLDEFEVFELYRSLLIPAILPIAVEYEDLRLSDSIKIDLDDTVVVFLSREAPYSETQTYAFPIFNEIINPRVSYTRFDTEFTEL